MKAIKEKLLKILERILKNLAQATIRKYKPRIIGVTGSFGKSSTKEAIYLILKDNFRVRTNHGNFNNELGFPLTIIGDYENVSGFGFWVRVVFDGVFNLFIKRIYPEILVLEYAADKPGDLDYLTEIAKPNIAVVTGVSKTPVHVEFYNGPEAVALEKSKLVRALPEEGFAVLNSDDEFVSKMSQYTTAATMTYGFEAGADMLINKFSNISEKGEPKGIGFKIDTFGKSLPIKIDGAIGRPQAYAVAAALSVAAILRLNLHEIIEKISKYNPLPGRARIIRGINDSWIIDDSYNASPAAVTESLKTLHDVSGERKIAVLGDMLELGRYSDEAHREAGKIAAKNCDIILTVGERAKKIAEGAIAAKFNKKNIFSFNDSRHAGIELKSLLRPGDLVLIKGSQSIRMEKATILSMAEPIKAKELLPRQYGNWLQR